MDNSNLMSLFSQVEQPSQRVSFTYDASRDPRSKAFSAQNADSGGQQAATSSGQSGQAAQSQGAQYVFTSQVDCNI